MRAARAVAALNATKSIHEPGTVGTSRYGRVFRTPDGWVFDDGSVTSDPAPRDFRPLVVLDPEDAEQVDRLTKAIIEACYADGNVVCADNGIHPDTTQRALREFANPTPPKPAEPTGLGAVVEDAEGNRWVRASQYVTSHRNDWHREAGTSTGADRRHYDGIPAVRVLSSGVES